MTPVTYTPPDAPARFTIALAYPEQPEGYTWSGIARSAGHAETRARLAYLWDTGRDHDAVRVVFFACEAA